MNRQFAPGEEFSLIEALFGEGHFSATGEGLGDDGFVWRPSGQWAVTTDCSVEGIHYRLEWSPPPAAIRKALLANLSDLNAMGARAELAFLNLGALRAWDREDFRRLGDTLRSLEKDHGFRVAGGDTVRKAEGSFFAFTVMGRIAGRPLLRSQARPGQRVYVSGKLGGAAAGLALLLAGHRPGDPAWEPYFRSHLDPTPPLGLGPALAVGDGPVAAIDISDGLSSELWHISRQSGCRLLVEWSKLPFDGGLARLPGGEAWRDWVLHGGEEYQLLFTGEFTPAELAALARECEIREIGRVEAGEGVGLLDESGSVAELAAGGWSH